MTSEIGFLIRFEPAKAKAKILDALRKSGCHKGRAADLLGCRPGTMSDWIKALGLESSIESLAKKARREGWYDVPVGGRPPTTKKTESRKKRRATATAAS